MSASWQRSWEELCAQLYQDTMHLIGCDYTPAFKSKGEVQPIVCEHMHMYPMLQWISLRVYVCTLYGQKVKDVNSVCYHIVMNNYKPHSKDTPLEKIKGIQVTSLPSCCSTLQQHIPGANNVHLFVVTKCWQSDMTHLKPEDSGWVFQDNHWNWKWHTCPVVPTIHGSHLNDVISHGDTDEWDEHDIDYL